MKLYLVIYDSYDDGWGSYVELGGVFDNFETAKLRAAELPNTQIYSVFLNDAIDEYLGGYIE